MLRIFLIVLVGAGLAALIGLVLLGIDRYTTVAVAAFIRGSLFGVIWPAGTVFFWVLALRHWVRQRNLNVYTSRSALAGRLVAGCAGPLLVAWLCYYFASIAVQFAGGKSTRTPAVVQGVHDLDPALWRGRRNRCATSVTVLYQGREASVCILHARPDVPPLADFLPQQGEAVVLQLRENRLGTYVEKVLPGSVQPQSIRP